MKRFLEMQQNINARVLKILFGNYDLVNSIRLASVLNIFQIMLLR